MFGFIVVITIYIYNLKFKCAGYSCLIFPDNNLWTVKEKYEETKFSWRGLFTHPKYVVRLYKVGNISAQQAEEFTKVSTMKISGLFDVARSPYAGEISDKIICSGKLRPEEGDITAKSGIQIHYYSSFLNDRLQYGACTEGQISHKVFSGMFYCKKLSEWYHIELIVPIQTALDNDAYKVMFYNTGCGN